MNRKGFALGILERVLDLDKEQLKIANHVKDCENCLVIMQEASAKCEKHYRESN